MSKTFKDVCNDVARELPEGWLITIGIDGNCGGYFIELTDDCGDEHEFPSNHESMEYEVYEALQYAIKYVKENECPT